MSKDYLNVEKDYPELLAHLMNIIISVEGQKAEEKYKLYAHGLAIKILRHCIEILNLYNVSEIIFESKTSYKFIDFSTINVLTRVVLEAFSTLYFVYCDDKDEIEFRYLVWQLGGYIERQGYSSEMEESKKKLEEEAKKIIEIKEKIQSNISFSKLPKALQNRALNGDWKLGIKIPELVEKSGFNKEYVGKNYSFLCSYSHNSWSSVMQVYEGKSLKIQKDLSYPILQFSLMILANTIYWYSSLNKKSLETFEKDKYRFDCTIAWKNFGLYIKSCEAEVKEFIEDKLNLEENTITSEITFESLSLNNDGKANLIKKFADKKKYDFNEFNIEEILKIEDFVKQYIIIRNKNT